ncbi:MAG: asparagine synthase-related protein [Patescibacteria group bacterium]|nr:asparagine synthase-related protein [Patescibacteria group bacterium]
MAITKESWENKIKLLRSQEEELDLSKKEITRILANKIEQVVVSQAETALKKGKIGVLFSGGVDSTLIAFILKKNNIDFQTMTIGFRDNDEQKLPEDIEESRESSKYLEINYNEKILSFEEIKVLFKETINILGEDLANVVNLGVGSVEIAGIKELKNIDSEISQIFGGLGSEEIFAGYQRHKQSDDKHNECWDGLNNMYERDLLRDFAISKSLDIDFYTPFLDEGLISFSMNIPIRFKISEIESKIILRESALLLGLDKKFSFRPKRAAQYGSRTDKAIEKLTKQNGYKYKKDYIKYLLDK